MLLTGEIYMELFDPRNISKTKYLFFTGKGGVGKTSAACATAVYLADSWNKVLLISTDPASNLRDVFGMELDNKGTAIGDVPGLYAADLDPIQAAAEYRESVIAPYRGMLPEAVIKNMEEQLSGSCTIEIAAFNEFSKFITDEKIGAEYDHILFDTAPTGHTLRMLQLPSAWSSFISESTHGASCLGQLAGLESKKEIYKRAVETLANADATSLILVSRPEEIPLAEAERASTELAEQGIKNQTLLINGVLTSYDDRVSESLYLKQQKALSGMPRELQKFTAYMIPLRSYNITGTDNLRSFLKEDRFGIRKEMPRRTFFSVKDVIDDLYNSGKKIIFTMGKGGVGKTTVAASIALGLSGKGIKVRLTTTDPAAHLKFVLGNSKDITVSRIDERAELIRYREEVISKAKETMSEDDIAYIEEDLRSPCTQEIAVFRAFAEIVDSSRDCVTVIDTAPTGHTLLLLESTQSYNREIQRTKGDVPESVKRLLPRLRDPDETEVVIVTLAEATPVYEALRLEEDLKRAKISSKWWIINASLCGTGTTNRLLFEKAAGEVEWIDKVIAHAEGNAAVIPWSPDELKDEKLNEFIGLQDRLN
jgi:arsenite-transporting ATPase